MAISIPKLKPSPNHPLLLRPQISPHSLSSNARFPLSSPFPKLRSRLSIHGVSPLLQTTPPPAAAPITISDSAVEFLVDSLGFLEEEALVIAAKLNTFKCKNSPVSVAHFFEQIGLNPSQIRTVVSSVPKILGSSVEKNLRPKIAALHEIGISGSDLVKFISNNPHIIESSLHATILPTFELMRSVFDSDEKNMVLAIKRGVRMLNSATYARRNIELLRSYGVSEQRIQRSLLRFPKSLYGKPEWMEDVVVRVEEELGIPRQSAMFMYGVDTLATISKKTLETKYEIFKLYGWSQSEIMTLARKLPSCLRLSDVKIKSRLDYFMNELGFDAEYLAAHPVLLKLSMEKRVRPRNEVLRILREKRLIDSSLSFWTVMALAEDVFLRRFVFKYKDVVPDVYDIYVNDKGDQQPILKEVDKLKISVKVT